MFREDFTSPTGLIRRCLIYSCLSFHHPAFVAGTLHTEPCVITHMIFKAFGTWCQRAPFKIFMELNVCQAASWTTSILDAVMLLLVDSSTIQCPMQEKNRKYTSHPLRRSDLQETKKPTRNIQGTTTLGCSPGRQRQRKTFYPVSVLWVNSYLCFQ